MMHNTFSDFFAFESDLDGAEGIEPLSTEYIYPSSQNQQMPSASVALSVGLDSEPLHDSSSNDSEDGMCRTLEPSRESHKNSDTDSFEAEHDLSHSIDHELSHQWEDCNEKARYDVYHDQICKTD